MAFIDLINQFKAIVDQRFTNKTVPLSIKKTDSSNSFKDLADLLLELSNTTVLFNSDKIPFATTEDNPQLVLADYNTNYKQLYGNNPFLAIYDNQGNYVGDGGTPPTIEYETTGDPTSDILSITWDYGVSTDGYIQIAGAPPTGSTRPSGAIELTYTQAALLLDTNSGNYYLPLMIGTTQVPTFTMYKEVEQPTNYDRTYTPYRLYGFSNNETGLIKVTVV